MSEKYTETEQKFLPLFPERLERFRRHASEVVQIYLSHPDEEFSLRLREKTAEGVTSYTATLKNAGEQTDQGLRRHEFEPIISRKLYDYYQEDAPTVKKYRAEPHRNIAIDFFDDGHIHLESEHPGSWLEFVRQYGMEYDFVDITGDRIVDNEWRAHRDYRRNNDGQEALTPKPDLNLDEIEADILHAHTGKPLIVAVGGRSGSGKSTLVRQQAERLREHGLTTTTISTDDYNYGNTYLYSIGNGTWENYDDNRTYNLTLCRTHLGNLASGLSVPRRLFDYESEEPVISGEIQPVDVTFVEGIKAHHPLFRDIADLYYEVPTPLATCIGRRIMRDLTERPRFSPEQNLEHYLKYTEPEYRALL